MPTQPRRPSGLGFLTLLALAFLFSAPAQADSVQRSDFVTMLRLARIEAEVEGSVDRDFLAQIRFVIQQMPGMRPGSTLSYPNGRTATSFAHKDGATLYYPNGRTATSFSGQTGATWYYPNGRTATSFFRKQGSTFYWPNGRTLTSFAGKVGATWYHSNGRTATSFAGKAGSTWYDQSGSTYWNNGPSIPENDLVNPPYLVTQMDQFFLP